MRTALYVVVSILIFDVGFIAGCWWNSHDRRKWNDYRERWK